MKKILFITISLISGLLFASSPKSQEGGAGKPEPSQSYLNRLHMAVAYGDLETLRKKVVYIIKERMKETGESWEVIQSQLKREVMMAPFERGTLWQHEATLEKCEDGYAYLKINERSNSGLQGTVLKAKLPGNRTNWAFLQNFIGERVCFDLQSVTPLSEQASTQGTSSTEGACFQKSSSAGAVCVPSNLNADIVRIAPLAYVGLTPVDIAILNVERALALAETMPPNDIKSTTFDIIKDKHGKMQKVVVDFFLEGGAPIFAHFFGYLLCHGRDAQSVGTGVADDHVKPWPQKRFDLILSLYPKIRDSFLTRRDMISWLDKSEQALTLTSQMLGRPNAAGLKYPVPMVFFASRARHMPALRTLLDAKAETNYVWLNERFKKLDPENPSHQNANSTLMTLLSNGPESRAIEQLVGAKVDVNFLNPLYFASRVGNLESVRILLDAKAHVNQTYKRGGSSLAPAAQLGHLLVCQMLIIAKADVNHRLFDGSTPLYFAVQNGHADVLSYLLSMKANPNIVETGHGLTLLYMATSQNHPLIVRTLLEHKAHINHRMNSGSTALCSAARGGESHNECLEILLLAKADPNLDENPTNAAGPVRRRLPIILAFDTSNTAAISMLIEHGSQLTQGRWSALHAAVVINQPSIIRQLIHKSRNLGIGNLFCSGPGGLPHPLVQHRNPLRQAVEGRKIACLMELALLTEEHMNGSKSFVCERHCGFSGTYETVKKHEDSDDCPNRRGNRKKRSRDSSSGATVDGESGKSVDQPRFKKAFRSLLGPLINLREHHLDKLATPIRNSQDGAAQLDYFRKSGVSYVATIQADIGRRETTSHYLNLIKDWSRFHLIAAAGDAYAMHQALIGRRGDFHKPNPARLNVKSIIEKAKKRSLLGHHYGPDWEHVMEALTNRTPYPPYETKEMEYLERQASACWSPNFEVHKYFGMPASVCMESLITFTHELEKEGVRSMTLFMTSMMGYTKRGWFEYDGMTVDGEKRRNLEARMKLLATITKQEQDQGNDGAYQEGGAAKENHITVQTRDGKRIQVNSSLAIHCALLRKMIAEDEEESGASDEEEIPQLPILSKDLHQILSFLEYYNQQPYDHSVAFPGYLFTSDCPDYCKNFFARLMFSSPRCSELFSFLDAADYLGVHSISWAGRWALASYFKGKKPSEQRAILKVGSVSEATKQRVEETYPCFKLMKERAKVMKTFSEKTVKKIIDLEIRKKALTERLSGWNAERRKEIEDELISVNEKLEAIYQGKEAE